MRSSGPVHGQVKTIVSTAGLDELRAGMRGLDARGLEGSIESKLGRFSDPANADVLLPAGAKLGSASSHG